MVATAHLRNCTDYLYFAAFPLVFSGFYGFELGTLGLTYISIVVVSLSLSQRQRIPILTILLIRVSASLARSTAPRCTTSLNRW